jgi:hypothetical protein
MGSDHGSLENRILVLTMNTPTGGTFRLGKHTFSVRLAKDYWEWEYQGVTYTDPKDLAEAMLERERVASGVVLQDLWELIRSERARL